MAGPRRQEATQGRYHHWGKWVRSSVQAGSSHRRLEGTMTLRIPGYHLSCTGSHNVSGVSSLDEAAGCRRSPHRAGRRRDVRSLCCPLPKDTNGARMLARHGSIGWITASSGAASTRAVVWRGCFPRQQHVGEDAKGSVHPGCPVPVVGNCTPQASSAAVQTNPSTRPGCLRTGQAGSTSLPLRRGTLPEDWTCGIACGVMLVHAR